MDDVPIENRTRKTSYGAQCTYHSTNSNVSLMSVVIEAQLAHYDEIIHSIMYFLVFILCKVLKKLHIKQDLLFYFSH